MLVDTILKIFEACGVRYEHGDLCLNVDATRYLKNKSVGAGATVNLTLDAPILDVHGINSVTFNLIKIARLVVCSGELIMTGFPSASAGGTYKKGVYYFNMPDGMATTGAVLGLQNLGSAPVDYTLLLGGDV